MKKTIASVVFGVLFASTLGACTVVQAPNEPTRPRGPKAKPNPPPAETPQDAGKQGEGKPPSERPGNSEAFYVWHDASGWHVRTTTAKKEHRFYGRVVAKDGEIKAVKATSTDRSDEVILEGPEVKFDFTTTGAEDGFDVTTATPGVCMGFHLFIDGQNAPKEKMIVGAGELKPPSNHFQLCP